MKKNTKYILLIFIVALFFYLIMCVREFYYGHDFYYHYYQIEDYLERININFLSPSLISHSLANSFGYGASLFYPPLFHILTAYFIKITSSDIIFGINFISFFGFFFSGITMYFLALKLFHNERVSFLASILYLFFPYHVADIFTRAALAESFSFIFFPMIITGILELIDEHYSKFYLLFTVGYILSIYSHYLSAFFFTFFLIPIFFLCRKKLFDKKKVVALLISSLFICATSLPLIVSILQHKILGNYRVFSDNVMFSSSSFLTSVLLPSDYFLWVENGFKSGVAVFISYEVWFLLLFLFMNRRKIEVVNRETSKILLIMSIIILMFLCFKPIWYIVPSFFQIIQFVWRLMLILSIPLILLAASALSLMKDKVQKILLCCFIFTSINVDSNIESVSMGWKMNPSRKAEERYSLGHQNEYFPISLSEVYYRNRSKDILLLEENADIEILESNTPYLEFKVENLQEDTRVELPRIYYLGYELKDNEGNKLVLRESENGFLETTLKKDGTYTLKYKGTCLYNFSKIVASLSLVVFFFWYFKIIKRRKV